LAKFAAADRAVQECGERIVSRWPALGVKAHLMEANQLYLTVS
jgi:hypothetical protein